MAAIEKAIRDWAAKAVYQSVHCKNEEHVRDYLVTPFFELLGYTARDPRVFSAEFRFDLASKSAGRADLMLFAKGRPEIVVECKGLTRNLDDPAHQEQLVGYMRAVTDISVGVLTNGIIYKFFAETDSPDIMDREPFLQVDLQEAQNGLSPAQIEFFEHFIEANYDEGFIVSFATEELTRIRMVAWLTQELKNPSNDFCRLALKGQHITHVRDLQKYKKLLQDAFAQGLAFEIYQQIKEPNLRRPAKTVSKTSRDGSGVITTLQERRIFEYAKQRIRHLGTKAEKVAAESIYYNDWSKHFTLFYMRPAKGRLFDYYELNREDRFVFPPEIQPREIIGIENIDKPLMTIFRSRLEQAKNWSAPMQDFGRGGDV